MIANYFNLFVVLYDFLFFFFFSYSFTFFLSYVHLLWKGKTYTRLIIVFPTDDDIVDFQNHSAQLGS